MYWNFVGTWDMSCFSCSLFLVSSDRIRVSCFTKHNRIKERRKNKKKENCKKEMRKEQKRHKLKKEEKKKGEKKETASM
jgi:hypothetical protein